MKMSTRTNPLEWSQIRLIFVSCTLLLNLSTADTSKGWAQRDQFYGCDSALAKLVLQTNDPFEWDIFVADSETLLFIEHKIKNGEFELLRHLPIDYEVRFIPRNSVGDTTWLDRLRNRNPDPINPVSGWVKNLVEKYEPGKGTQINLIELVDQSGRIIKIKRDWFVPEKTELVLSPMQVPENVLKAHTAAEAARASGIRFVYHSTNFESLIGILKDGQIKARDLSEPKDHLNWGHPAVYLQLDNPIERPKGNWGITLEFEPELLNRNDYYVTKGWAHGAFSKKSVLATEPKLKRLFYAIGSGRLTAANEVVFANAVKLTELKRIVVLKLYYKRLLKALQVSNIQPPNGRKWSELIVVSDQL